MGEINPLKYIMEKKRKETSRMEDSGRPSEAVQVKLTRSHHRMVEEFHEKFDLRPSSDSLVKDQHMCEEDVRDRIELLMFRVGFLQEELSEYCLAVGRGDREKALDALVDLEYVLLGCAVLHKFDRYDEAFERVHAVNMMKERASSDGSNSARTSKFDVIKPANWKPAYLGDLL